MKSIFTFLLFLCTYALMAQAPANDDCAGAIELILDDASHEVSAIMIDNASQSSNDILFFNYGRGILYSTNRTDLWYKFTATSSIVDVVIPSPFPTIYLYKGSDCDNLEFINAYKIDMGMYMDFTGSTKVFTDLAIGEAYYLRVFTDSAYTIGLSSQDPCGNNADPFTLEVVPTNQAGIFTLQMSGGTPPYRLLRQGADFIGLDEYDNQRPYTIDLNSNYSHFIAGVDTTKCTRVYSIPGVFYSNINKVSLADYKMSVFPNPAHYSSKVSLSVEKATRMQIQITSINGQVLSNEVVFVEGDMAFDLKISDLPNGIYLVSAISENGIQTKELVISK